MSTNINTNLTTYLVLSERGSLTAVSGIRSVTELIRLIQINKYSKIKSREITFKTSVAKPKLFIFGSGSDFVHNFGSSSSHILPLKPQ